MNRHKKKLIILITIQITLTVIHKVLDKPPSEIDNWVSEAGWHYWVALIFGMYLIIYMFTLSCKKCGAKQLWRSHNILEWRWPKDKCWSCGEKQ